MCGILRTQTRHPRPWGRGSDTSHGDPGVALTALLRGGLGMGRGLPRGPRRSQATRDTLNLARRPSQSLCPRLGSAATTAVAAAREPSGASAHSDSQGRRRSEATGAACSRLPAYEGIAGAGHTPARLLGLVWHLEGAPVSV